MIGVEFSQKLTIQQLKLELSVYQSELIRGLMTRHQIPALVEHMKAQIDKIQTLETQRSILKL